MPIPAPARIEGATLAAWPALEEARDGSWLWRGARGYTKRANAIHCLDPADDADPAGRLDRMIARSERHGIRPTLRVTPLTPAAALREIAGRGWIEYEPSRVLVMEMPAAEWPVAHRTKLLSITDPAWQVAQADMAGTRAADRETFAAILAAVQCEARGVLAYDANGRPASAAMAAVHDGIGVYLNVVTRTEARQQGYGRAVMAAALNWSRAAGATHAAIQVLGANAVAIALYASFGFAEAYGYHYRIPPEDSSPS